VYVIQWAWYIFPYHVQIMWINLWKFLNHAQMLAIFVILNIVTHHLRY